MKKRKTVFVLMDGRSPEHEISLISSKEVARNINEEKFEVFPVLVSRDCNDWKIASTRNLLQSENPLNIRKTRQELGVKDSKYIQSVNKLKVKDKSPVVFIGKQGKNEITVEEIANKLGTINYEVVYRVNPLIKKFIV